MALKHYFNVNFETISPDPLQYNFECHWQRVEVGHIAKDAKQAEYLPSTSTEYLK